MKELKIGNYILPALVDDEDYERVSKYCWTKSGRSDTCSITRYTNVNGHISLAAEILGYTKKLIDHKDRNPLNNQKYNLRIATSSQNKINQLKRKGTYSKYKGVYFRKTNKTRPWIACIRIKGVLKHLGQYNAELEAALKYDEWAKKLHGEFAVLNSTQIALHD
jgi:hypothetical protein